MRFKILLLITIFMIVQAWFVFTKKKEVVCKDKSPVVAVVGKHKITINEIKKELSKVSQRKLDSIQTMQGKIEFIEELRIKQVLLQEAQRLNFHKRQEFMNSIEGYWKQTLIKYLTEQKLKEITDITKVGDSEVDNFYKNMKFKYNVKICRFSDRKDAVDFKEKLVRNGKDVFDKDSVKYDWKIMDYEELFSRFGNFLDDKAYYVVSRQDDEHWVIAIDERHATELESLEKLKGKITKIIHDRKVEVNYRQWQDELVQSISYKLDKDALGKI